MGPRNWSGWTKLAAFVFLVAFVGALWGWRADEAEVDGGGQAGEPGPLALDGSRLAEIDRRSELPPPRADGPSIGESPRGSGAACNVGATAGGPRLTAPHVGIWNDRVTVFELDENACPRPVEITARRARALPDFQRAELERGIPFQTNEEKYLILEGLEAHR